MGKLVDFSAGYPKPEALKAAGVTGVIGYFSGAREPWMVAKPVSKSRLDMYQGAGIDVVANYQFGKGATADWRGGYVAGRYHAEQMKGYLEAAGLDPTGDYAKYGPVDDNPTLADYNSMIAPFFRGWESIFGHEWSGAYANTHTIDWLVEDRMCSWFWQHGWDGRAANVPLTPNPSAHILQYEIDKRSIDGIGVDLNNQLQYQFGAIGQRDGNMADVLNQLMGPVAK